VTDLGEDFVNRYYICAVATAFAANYEIGVRKRVWGVTNRNRRRIAPVEMGDFLIFTVGGEFRSIHPINSAPYVDQTIVWPARSGDAYANRIRIGDAIIEGRVRVADLAGHITFMRNVKAWGGTLQGANGVFNDRLTRDDVTLIEGALRNSAPLKAERQKVAAAPAEPLLVSGTTWLPGLLDQLARSSELIPFQRASDPFSGAEAHREGLVTGVYVDRSETPTLALLPVERPAENTVISALYGLSALTQSAKKPGNVRGIVYVPGGESHLEHLLVGIPNLASVRFELAVSIQR
jgi:hypothetical protein